MIPRIRFVNLSIASGVVLLAVAFAGENRPFRAGQASEYAHQQSENVTVGAKPFTAEEAIGAAFGKKIDFPRYGVVPVLVVVENKRDKALDLRGLEVSLVATDGRHAAAVAPEDLISLATAGKHPSQNPARYPVPLPKKKNPFNTPEIVERAFSAKMLPPGDSASGFFYFEASPESGDKVYLNGMKDARSGEELLYFEFPLVKEP